MKLPIYVQCPPEIIAAAMTIASQLVGDADRSPKTVIDKAKVILAAAAQEGLWNNEEQVEPGIDVI